jgi:hypothetical protein
MQFSLSNSIFSKLRTKTKTKNAAYVFFLVKQKLVFTILSIIMLKYPTQKFKYNADFSVKLSFDTCFLSNVCTRETRNKR